jgi:hypothetical protein
MRVSRPSKCDRIASDYRGFRSCIGQEIRIVAVRGALQDPAVATDPPTLVVWTDHAVVKADLLGATRTDVEDAVLQRHGERTRNTGAADWLLVVGRLAIAYNHPDGGDQTTARVVTLWRRG